MWSTVFVCRERHGHGRRWDRRRRMWRRSGGPAIRWTRGLHPEFDGRSHVCHVTTGCEVRAHERHRHDMGDGAAPTVGRSRSLRPLPEERLPRCRTPAASKRSDSVSPS